MVDPTPLFPSLQSVGDGSSGPPDPPDDDMQARVAKLESLAEKTGERLNAIERDLAVIKSNYATKADLAEGNNRIIMWVVGAIFLAQLLPAVLQRIGL